MVFFVPKFVGASVYFCVWASSILTLTSLPEGVMARAASLSLEVLVLVMTSSSSSASVSLPMFRYALSVRS